MSVGAAASSFYSSWIVVLCMTLLLLLLLPTSVVNAATDGAVAVDANCIRGTEQLMNQTSIAQAEENVLKAVDPLLCEQGNRQDTKVVCGTDYQRDAATLYDNYEQICVSAGGQFQTATTGVECSHSTERSIDYDWFHIPHCVHETCPPDYAQSSFNTSFFQGYRKSQEENNFTCQFTSAAAAATKSLQQQLLWMAGTAATTIFLVISY